MIPRPTDRTQFTPIDHFFESLARFARDRAIAVVLSGTGSDGAIGVREIKAVGGITMVQDPATAKYDGMSRAAMATGFVDLVLSPDEIADHLGQVRDHPYLRGAAQELASEPDITDAHLHEVFALLRRASTIDFKQYKTPTVKRRLLRRMALLRVTEADAYVRYLAQHAPEATALSRDLLIHVTRFFRDPDSFGALAEHVLPDLLDSRREDPLRIWVPGCATGEEAYTLAICLIEFLGDRIMDHRIQIFATDASDTAIDTARRGTYPVTIAADVSAPRLKRFFTKSDGGCRIVKLLRDMCVFARHDLTRDPPFSRLDLIICRNVLIYLDASLQKRLTAVFHYALKSRGFLMLGPAETVGAQSAFTLVDKRWRIFVKRPVEMAPMLPLPRESGMSRSVLPARAGADGAVPAKTVQEEANRVVLERYGPAGVLIDSHGQIVQFRGQTGPYLEASAGNPDLNVLKMARHGLLQPLRAALTSARRGTRPVRTDGVRVKRGSGWAETTLEVVPLMTSQGQHFLVLFSEPKRAIRAAAGKGDKSAGDGGRVKESRAGAADLRRELAASREYLQSIIQELEAANEELQSANEELQSTNEELDTAKEELQSTNEELNTVNEELHSRNDELTRANSDLGNLLGSVDIAIVIVSNELGIRRFTPKAENLFNLIPGDVGRSIIQINPNFVVEDLDAMIRETIDEVAPQEREVQDKTGRWHLLRVRPYKGTDNRLDGAVLSLLDIDDSKGYSAHVERTRDYFKAIAAMVRQPLLVLDAKLQVQFANQAFHVIFGVPPHGIDNRALDEAAGGLLRIPELTGMLHRVLDLGTEADATIAHTFPSVGHKRLTINGRRLELGEQGPSIVVAIEDATSAKG